MSRIEMVECDLASCSEASANGTSGYTTCHFEGVFFDFCSAEHQLKWEGELKRLDPARRKRKKPRSKR